MLLQSILKGRHAPPWSLGFILLQYLQRILVCHLHLFLQQQQGFNLEILMFPFSSNTSVWHKHGSMSSMQDLSLLVDNETDGVREGFVMHESPGPDSSSALFGRNLYAFHAVFSLKYRVVQELLYPINPLQSKSCPFTFYVRGKNILHII